MHQRNKVCRRIENICIGQTSVREEPDSNLGQDICYPNKFPSFFINLRYMFWNIQSIVSRPVSSIMFRIYHSLLFPPSSCNHKINNDGRHLSVPVVFLFSWPYILNVRLRIYPYIFTRKYFKFVKSSAAGKAPSCCQ